MSRLGWTALILSLGLNAGMLAVVGVKAYRDWRRYTEYARNFKDGRASVKRASRMYDEYYESRMAIGRRFPGGRERLGRLGLEERPDSLAVERVLDSLAARSRAFDSLLHDFLGRLLAERRPDLVQRWRERAPYERESLRVQFEAACRRARERR